MFGVSRVSLLLAVYMLAGCSALRTDVRSEAPPGYQADAASKTASVDWSKVQTVTVGMNEYNYVPSSLNFEAGKPYRLHLGNSGSKSHTFSSEPFFKSIAARRLTTKDGTVEAPFIQELVVAPGQAADLEFVALTPGDYPLVCNEPLHESVRYDRNHPCPVEADQQRGAAFFRIVKKESKAVDALPGLVFRCLAYRIQKPILREGSCNAQDDGDRSGGSRSGERGRHDLLRRSRSRDQSVLFRAARNGKHRPHAGAPRRGRLAHGGRLYPRQGRQYRRLRRHLGPGRDRHDHRPLFGAWPTASRSSASPARRPARGCTRKISRRSTSRRSPSR